MKEINALKKLAGNPPEAHLDVTDRVMREIRGMRRGADDSKPMWWAAILSSGAALAVVLLAMQSIADFQDPFGGFLNSIWTVLR
jgi:anti-sigma factor RsiW